GTAMNNTMRQVAGSVDTALLVTIMTKATIPEQGVEGMIRGVHVSFIVAGIFAIIALVLAFFVKNTKPVEMPTQQGNYMNQKNSTNLYLTNKKSWRMILLKISYFLI